MTITTLDGVIAGFQPPIDFARVAAGTQVVGRLYSPFYTVGRPGPAVAPSPGMAGAALTSYLGQIPFSNGAAKQYLARFSAWSSQICTFILCDRLWHNSGIAVTTTGAQTIDSVAWPARDSNGSINGAGVRVGLEVSTATGAGASVLSLSYTDQDGNAGATASPRAAYGASSIIGQFYDFALAAGDTGIRSIQTYTSTVSMSSGAVHLVAYRELARVAVTQLGTEAAVDVLTSGMPELFDDTVPFILMLPGLTSSPHVVGQVIYTHG